MNTNTAEAKTSTNIIRTSTGNCQENVKNTTFSYRKDWESTPQLEKEFEKYFNSISYKEKAILHKMFKIISSSPMNNKEDGLHKIMDVVGVPHYCFKFSSYQLKTVSYKYIQYLEVLKYFKFAIKRTNGKYGRHCSFGTIHNEQLFNKVFNNEFKKEPFRLAKEALDNRCNNRHARTNKIGKFFFDLDDNAWNMVKQSPKETLENFNKRIERDKNTVNDFNNKILKGKIQPNGRVTTNFLNLPKVIRSKVKHANGKDVFEVDINAAIPRLLGVVMDKLLTSTVNYERKRLNLYYSNVYKQVYTTYVTGVDASYTQQYYSLKNEINKYNTLVNADGDTYINLKNAFGLNHYTRANFKQILLSSVFDIDWDVPSHKDEVKDAFQAMFPLMYKKLVNNNKERKSNKADGIKSKLTNSIVDKIFNLESSIVKRTIALMKTDPNFKDRSFLTIYDGIVVGQDNLVNLIASMKTAFMEKTSTELKYSLNNLTKKDSSNSQQTSPSIKDQINDLIKELNVGVYRKTLYRTTLVINGIRKDTTIKIESKEEVLLEWLTKAKELKVNTKILKKQQQIEKRKS